MAPKGSWPVTGRGGNGMESVNNFGRNLALWVIVALLLVALFNLFQPSGTAAGAQQVAYSDFLNGGAGAGHVRDVVIQGRTVSGQLSRRPDLPDLHAGRPGLGRAS